MKNNKKLLMLGTAMVTLSGLVAASRAKGAAGTGTATADMSAVILEAITIATVSDLIFGAFVAPTAAAATPTVNADGTSNAGGLATVATPAPQAARLTLTGTANQKISISAIADDTVTNGTTNMDVKNFVINFVGKSAAATSAGTSGPVAATLSASGVGEIYVGADLFVGVNQKGGVYTGDFKVSANYP